MSGIVSLPRSAYDEYLPFQYLFTIFQFIMSADENFLSFWCFNILFDYVSEKSEASFLENLTSFLSRSSLLLISSFAWHFEDIFSLQLIWAFIERGVSLFAEFPPPSPYKRLFNFLPEMKNYRNVSLKIFLWERQTLQRIINLLKVSQEWFNGNFCSFYSQGERKPHKRFFFIIFITLFPFISFLRLWLIQKFCPNFCSS